MLETISNNQLILKILVDGESIVLITTKEKQEELATYILKHMEAGSLCILKDCNGIINAACKGKKITGFSFEVPSVNLYNKYLKAAIDHFNVSTKHLNNTMQSEDWKYPKD